MNIKEGKWFVSAKLRNILSLEEKGDWLNSLNVCIQIAETVNQIHNKGLVHLDLSWRNIWIDINTWHVYLICTEDNIICNGEYSSIETTPDFIAPEVVATKNKNLNRVKTSILTNRHSLSVLIYMHLLYRHPLRGGKVNDLDAAKDEELSMGSKALFIEHPTDKSNRPKVDQLSKCELPQGDVTKMPYTICGPYLKALFDRAFIDGLHNPVMRPSAAEWVQALIDTRDLMRSCQNPSCEYKWFVFDDIYNSKCPFCGI